MTAAVDGLDTTSTTTTHSGGTATTATHSLPGNQTKPNQTKPQGYGSPPPPPPPPLSPLWIPVPTNNKAMNESFQSIHQPTNQPTSLVVIRGNKVVLPYTAALVCVRLVYGSCCFFLSFEVEYQGDWCCRGGAGSTTRPPSSVHAAPWQPQDPVLSGKEERLVETHSHHARCSSSIPTRRRKRRRSIPSGPQGWSFAVSHFNNNNKNRCIPLRVVRTISRPLMVALPWSSSHCPMETDSISTPPYKWLVGLDPINDQWLVGNHRATRRTVSGIRRTTTTTLVFGIPLGRIGCDYSTTRTVAPSQGNRGNQHDDPFERQEQHKRHGLPPPNDWGRECR